MLVHRFLSRPSAPRLAEFSPRRLLNLFPKSIIAQRHFSPACRRQNKATPAIQKSHYHRLRNPHQYPPQRLFERKKPDACLFQVTDNFRSVDDTGDRFAANIVRQKQIKGFDNSNYPSFFFE
ncbi:MAG: hypothetical protein P8Y83_00385 [Gammaproteobacteria bacterium]|jgi:hypothetical protein